MTEKMELKRTKEGFKIPFMADIPVEKEAELNEEIRIELLDEQEKERKISVAFNNLNSKLRKIADYIYAHLNKELCYEDISKELDIPENTIRQLVSALNFSKEWGYTMQPVPKRAGYIQSVLKDEEAYEKWDRKKAKTIMSMSKVRRKAQTIVGAKQRVRAREKIKVKQKS